MENFGKDENLGSEGDTEKKYLKIFEELRDIRRQNGERMWGKKNGFLYSLPRFLSSPSVVDSWVGGSERSTSAAGKGNRGEGVI